MPETCSLHPDRPIAGVCTLCGRTACAECLVDLAGESYCKSCLEAKVRQPVRKVAAPWRLVLSFIPGVGHLYMGLLNRGFQIMAAAIIGGVVLSMLPGPLAPFWVAAVICYSIFDAREAHLRMQQGGEVPDHLLFDLRPHVSQKWLAYGMIAVGLLALYNTLMSDILPTLLRYSPLYWTVVGASRSVLFGAACLGVGVWLLRRQSRPAGPPADPTAVPPVVRPAGRQEEQDL